MMSKLFALLIMVLSCSCGYYWGIGEGLTSQYQTISVPYIEGDTDGALTAAVIKEIVRSGHLEYRSCGGNLTLFIKKNDLRDENIGFRYDRKKRGTLTKEIIPTETRITEFVEVSVMENCSQQIVLGPVVIAASVDFDHDYYFSRDGVNVFSLGQLIDIDSARESVLVPLHEKLAIKIVSYVTQKW